MHRKKAGSLGQKEIDRGRDTENNRKQDQVAAQIAPWSHFFQRLFELVVDGFELRQGRLGHLIDLLYELFLRFKLLARLHRQGFESPHALQRNVKFLILKIYFVTSYHREIELQGKTHNFAILDSEQFKLRIINVGNASTDNLTFSRARIWS